MTDAAVTILVLHLILAVILFFFINWIGAHAVDFGYSSATLFEEANESIALNFFIRATSPAIFIIALSALAVTAGYEGLRIGIYRVAIYYYVIRVAAIFLLNRQRLVSWIKFTSHAMMGVALAYAAYRYLIVPNRALVPDLENAGNELWLAILAFLYAVANKIPVSGGPSARRRNTFIKIHYDQAKRKFGAIINDTLESDILRLVAYAVLIFEDYARPPAVRILERWMFWKRPRTTGVMQVAGVNAFSDRESVARGAEILAAAWQNYASEEYPYSRVSRTIGEYNADSDYISRVMEIMEILAKRVEPAYRSAYESVFEE